MGNYLYLYLTFLCAMAMTAACGKQTPADGDENSPTSVLPNSDLGAIPLNKRSVVLLRIQNASEKEELNEIDIKGLEYPFAFEGGSYPGASSNCPRNRTLAPQQACNIAIAIAPQATEKKIQKPILLSYIFEGKKVEEKFELRAESTTRPLKSSIPDDNSLVAEALDFDQVNVGSTQLRKLSLQNLTSELAKNITISPSMTNSQFSIKNPQNCQQILPHATCELEVVFTPQQASPVFVEVFPLAYNLGTQAKTTQVYFRASATDPNSFIGIEGNQFAPITIQSGKKATLILTLRNNGEADAQIVGIDVGSEFTLDSASTCKSKLSLSRGADCIIILQAEPTATKSYAETLKLDYTVAGASKSQNFSLQGKIKVTTEALKAPAVLQISGNSFAPVTMNSGESRIIPLTLTSAAGSEPASLLNLAGMLLPELNIDPSSSCLGLLLKGGTQCVFNIIATPGASNPAFTRNLQLKYTSAGNSQTLPFVLSGSFTVRALPTGGAKTQLDALLKTLDFDDSQVANHSRVINYLGRTFKIDDNGQIYLEEKTGKTHPVDVYFEANNYYISDPNHPSAGLPSKPWQISSSDPKVENDFHNLLQIQREHGIFTMKKANTDCYYEYAKRLLKSPHPWGRLLALERPIDPRPLVFKNNLEWNDFKKELKQIFRHFRDPKAYISLLGTSTTFLSQNPKKGKNTAFFETPPKCFNSAANPSKIKEVHAFDTKSPAEPSDLDIHLFIPELSELCHKAKAPGNTGKRDVYWENTLDICFKHSANSEVKKLLRKGFFPKSANPMTRLEINLDKRSDFHKFIKKWQAVLGGREINFSVHILPHNLFGPLNKPGVRDFDADPNKRRRFVIPVN